MKLKAFLLISIFFLSSFLELSRQDLPGLRDMILQPLFENDLRQLSSVIELHKSQSEKPLKEYLAQLESKYASYPRLSLQLVDLYIQIGQHEQATQYLIDILSHSEKFCEKQWYFLIFFCLDHYKNPQSAFLSGREDLINKLLNLAPPKIGADFF